MPANTAPIFPLVPRIFRAKITSECTSLDMTSGPGTFNMGTAGSNGSRIDVVEVWAAGANAANVLRIYFNNGSASTTAANNFLIREMPLPQASASAVLAMHEPIYVPINRSIPAGWVLFGCVGTAPTNGWNVVAYGGDY